MLNSVRIHIGNFMMTNHPIHLHGLLVIGNDGGPTPKSTRLYASMAEMEMPLPDNTLPMMTGSGPFGPLEMGGMFTVVKVREGLARNDYRDPGWYRHPPGTVAYEWKGDL